MAVGDKIVIANKSEMLLDFENSYNAFGYTKELKKSNRFEETDTPYVIQDKGGDAIRFTKGLVNRDSIESIHLPLAPFADGSGDEVLSHSDNGFATQNDYKAGDIVHCGNGTELIDSSNDTSSADNWTPYNDANVSSSDGVLSVNADTTDYPKVEGVEDVFVSGVKYIVSATLGGTNPHIRAYSTSILGSMDETGSFVFTADKNTKLYFYMLGTGDDDTATLSNLSVKPVEQTYQATTSTAAGDLVTDSTKFSKIDFVSRQDVIFIGEDGKYKTIKGYHNFTAGFSVDDVANAYGCTKVGKGLFSVTDLPCVDYDGTEITYTGEITAISLVSRLNSKMYDVAHNPFGSRKDSDDKFWYEVDNQDTYSTLLKDVNSTSGRVDENNLGDKKLDDKVYFEGLGGLIFRNTLAVKPNKKDLLEDGTNKFVGVDEMSEEESVVTVAAGKFKLANSWGSISGGLDTDKALDFNINLGYRPTSFIGNAYGLGTVQIISDTGATIDGVLKNDGKIFVNSSNLSFSNSSFYTVAIGIANNQLLQQGRILTLDVVGNPAKYIIDDSPSDIHSDSTDSNDLLRQGALCWNVDENKMYVYLDTDDRDDVDMTAEDFTDTTKYEYVIGRYPNSWYDRLDSGLSLPFNALLVGQDGSSYVNVSSLDVQALQSRKAIELKQVLYTSVYQNVFTDFTPYRNLDPITNAIRFYKSYRTSNRIQINTYTSLPSPTTQADPKQVLMISDKVLAGNSHDKGVALGCGITGKVNTGNNTIFETNNFSNIVVDNGVLLGNGSHETIQLTNEDTVGYKAFTTLCVDDNDELLIGVVGEEMVWDFDKDGNVNIYWDKDDDDEIALVTGTVYEFIVEDPNLTSDNHVAEMAKVFGGTLYKFIGDSGSLNRNDVKTLIFEFEDGNTSNFEGITITSSGAIVSESSYSKCTNWELFDGSGFGDNEKFNKLTNGVITDLNGNTVRTYSGFKRTGYYI